MRTGGARGSVSNSEYIVKKSLLNDTISPSGSISGTMGPIPVSKIELIARKSQIEHVTSLPSTHIAETCPAQSSECAPAWQCSKWLCKTGWSRGNATAMHTIAAKEIRLEGKESTSFLDIIWLIATALLISCRICLWEASDNLNYNTWELFCKI